jgi:hypothetical protein
MKEEKMRKVRKMVQKKTLKSPKKEPTRLPFSATKVSVK